MKPTLTPIIDRESWLELRSKYVTSTQSPALFGLNMPSTATAFELWHINNGNISGNVAENDYMIAGRFLEAGVIEIIKYKNPEWRLMPMKVFAHSEDGMGASFDYVVVTPDKGRAILEIKTTSYREYKEKFVEDDNGTFIEMPDYYETQIQHQAEALNNEQYNSILTAVFILDTREIKYIWRDRDRDFGRQIRERIIWFRSLEQPPPPDLVKDSDLLARLHRANNTDTVFNGSENAEFNIATLAYIAENRKEKDAEAAKKRIRSQIILAMGTSRSGFSGNARVSNKSKFVVTETNTITKEITE